MSDERREPKVRRSGLCACGCRRPLPRGPQVRKYAGVQLDVDPFATSNCCKVWYGLITKETAKKAHAAAEQHSSTPWRGRPTDLTKRKKGA